MQRCSKRAGICSLPASYLHNFDMEINESRHERDLFATKYAVFVCSPVAFGTVCTVHSSWYIDLLSAQCCISESEFYIDGSCEGYKQVERSGATRSRALHDLLLQCVCVCMSVLQTACSITRDREWTLA